MTPKSCKYNKYPELPSTKTAHFMDDTPIFPFPSTKTTIFMDRKRQPKAVLSGRMELNYVKALLYKISFFMSEAPEVAPGAIVIVALPV